MTAQNWGILASVNGQYQAIHKNGMSYTTVTNDAMVFPSEEEAKAFAQTIKTPTLVQVLMGYKAEPDFKLPHPDYFESGDEFMTLDEVERAIRTEDKTSVFNPVSEITGGNQMTARAIQDAFTGNITGREIQFSFSRLLRDNDMETLREALARDPHYDAAGYTINRFGCVAYAVLTLRIKCK